jgi:multidrug efflux pump subunit AcrA (membrane-fusion protein)
MYAEVFLKTEDISEHLSIPVSALVDEDGLHTAYVQTEGESFQKRILKTGITDAGYIQVIEGIKEGERVVARGAYQVRLAALSPESAIGHGHVH